MLKYKENNPTQKPIYFVQWKPLNVINENVIIQLM